MPGAVLTIEVEGLPELVKAFHQLALQVPKEIRQEFKSIGEPVRSAAEEFAAVKIRNIGQSWGRIRLDVTRGGDLIYIAPRSRRKAGHDPLRYARPNLANLLLDRAMEPALEAKREQVVETINHILDVVGEEAGF